MRLGRSSPASRPPTGPADAWSTGLCEQRLATETRAVPRDSGTRGGQLRLHTEEHEPAGAQRLTRTSAQVMLTLQAWSWLTRMLRRARLLHGCSTAAVGAQLTRARGPEGRAGCAKSAEQAGRGAGSLYRRVHPCRAPYAPCPLPAVPAVYFHSAFRSLLRFRFRVRVPGASASKDFEFHVGAHKRTGNTHLRTYVQADSRDAGEPKRGAEWDPRRASCAIVHVELIASVIFAQGCCCFTVGWTGLVVR